MGLSHDRGAGSRTGDGDPRMSLAPAVWHKRLPRHCAFPCECGTTHSTVLSATFPARSCAGAGHRVRARGALRCLDGPKRHESRRVVHDDLGAVARALAGGLHVERLQPGQGVRRGDGADGQHAAVRGPQLAASREAPGDARMTEASCRCGSRRCGHLGVTRVVDGAVGDRGRALRRDHDLRHGRQARVGGKDGRGRALGAGQVDVESRQARGQPRTVPVARGDPEGDVVAVPPGDRGRRRRGQRGARLDSVGGRELDVGERAILDQLASTSCRRRRPRRRRRAGAGRRCTAGRPASCSTRRRRSWCGSRSSCSSRRPARTCCGSSPAGGCPPHARGTGITSIPPLTSPEMMSPSPLVRMTSMSQPWFSSCTSLRMITARSLRNAMFAARIVPPPAQSISSRRSTIVSFVSGSGWGRGDGNIVLRPSSPES